MQVSLVRVVCRTGRSGGESGTWHRLVIVRYRSRRDIADIFASAKFAQANVHKWAGLEKNQRLLMQGLHIPELTPFFIMLLILIGLRLLTQNGVSFYFVRLGKSKT